MSILCILLDPIHVSIAVLADGFEEMLSHVLHKRHFRKNNIWTSYCLWMIHVWNTENIVLSATLAWPQPLVETYRRKTVKYRHTYWVFVFFATIRPKSHLFSCSVLWLHINTEGKRNQPPFILIFNFISSWMFILSKIILGGFRDYARLVLLCICKKKKK